METGRSLTIHLLGGFELARDGRPAARPAYEKGRALLAYLAAETARAHPREKLAGMLWPSLSPKAARTNLRQVVLDLRRVLGDECLHTDRDTIRIERGDGIRFDIDEFSAPAPSCIARPTPAHCEPCVAQMEDMAACYRGEFMAGLALSDCPEFEDWLQVKREALHRHALAVLERLSNCLEHAGQTDRALPFALRYAELEPWNEEGQRRVMRLHLRNGQPSAAVGQYRSFCRVLWKELGVQPEEETQRLAARIADGELADAPAGPPPAPSLPASQGELRRVTILYCELIPPSEEDPEDAAALLASPQARCIEIVRRHGGHIVQKHGGALLAYFGLPQAREDAPLQAVRAALAAARETRPRLDVRATVHTGTVITGGDPALPDVIGTASALTIRLRRSIRAGEVAASAETLRLVEGYFTCEHCDTLAVQRQGTPLEIFRVLGETGAQSRLEARQRDAGGRIRTFPPFFGRKRELEALAGRWSEVCRSGRGGAMLLQGDAGIGKSALLHAFIANAKSLPQAPVEIRCTAGFPHDAFRSAVDDAVRPRQHAVVLVVEDAHRADPVVVEMLGELVTRAQESPVLALILARPDFRPAWPDGSCVAVRIPALDDDEIARIVVATAPGLDPETAAGIVGRADGVPLFAEELAKTALHGDPASIPANLHDLLAARVDSTGETKRIVQLAAAIGREFDADLLAAASGLPPAVLREALLPLQAAGILAGDARTTLKFRHALLHEAAYQSQLKADRRIAHRRIAQALMAESAGLARRRPDLLARHLALAGQARGPAGTA